MWYFAAGLDLEKGEEKMKYGLLPRGIWLIFSRSFQVALADVLQEPAPALVMKKAKRNYRSILSGVNEFDHDDRFVINIISCAMLAAVLQSVENPYEVSEIQAYYQVFTRAQIYDYLWNMDSYFNIDDTVRFHIQNLRRKIKAALDGNDGCIETVWGVGYRFNPTALQA